MTSFNLMESIIDEVALEGLDGITLQALWIRLANRFHDPLPLPKSLMEQVWSIIKKVKDFSFYELETPREPLVIFDRYEFVDPCLGIILEPPNVPPDIYPHCPIQDPKAGVRGSCSTYYTRKDIKNNVKNADLDEVTEKYGLSLVIVASQLIRTRALISVDVSPTLELTIMHYCFLERVGRARYHGEVTQGKLSLAALKEDPKTLFYHRKFLLHHKLITKQIHHQKTSSHTGSSSLLHLPRFYVERKPKMIYLAEQVLDILRSKENGVAEYDEIKRKLGIENSIKKLFRNSFFQKIAKTDICVPYRTLYPNAEPNEWRQKQDPSKEKKIRVVQLLYPDIDIVDVTWNKYEKDDDEDVIDMDVSNHKVNVPYLKQANAIIEASQLEGVSQAYLGKEMGLTKLQSRTFLRNMVKMGIIAKYMNDMGRQRITKYVSKKFEKGSKMSKQFNKEIHKIKELTKRITSDSDLKNKATLQVEDEKSSINNDDKHDQTINNDNKDDQTINNDDKDDQTSQRSDHQVNQTNIDAPIVNESEEKNKDIDCIKKNIELKNYTINRIMHKYQLSISKYKSKYKRTSQSLLVKMKNSNINVKKQKVKPNISSMQQIANAKATSFYNSIKTNLTAQKPVHTEKGVNEVFGFMEAVQNSEKNTSNITYRLLRRANMIIEAVKEHQVIDDISKLTKMICEEEDKEGYDVKIDKKSLIRLLQKLAKDNLVKNIKLTLSANGRTERNMMFICDPNIDTDHTVIKSAVEQAKVKFCLTSSSQKAKKANRQDKEDKTKENIVDKPSDSREQLQELNRTISKNTLFSVKYKSDAKAGKQYGLSPKFIRMQTMHILLFYLVYDHPGIPKLSQQEQIEILKSNDYEIDDNLIQEFSTIYNIEVGWKMFVPPLPKHSGWPEGWALMCDVLLGLPLSIFVKVHNITFIIPELEHYLNHPIRKHYLVKNLPVTIRNTLLHARKYIFNIHETVTRLCYIGLVQFGPQRLKDKDQVFIYLNRYTELMDTTSSAPNYHKIEDKIYPVTKYFFDRMQVVEKYWYDMWTICVNTPLGDRAPVHGKDILVEDLNKKTAMIEAIVARTSKQTKEMDTGAVPGDRKGAAGIDSAFFAHLKRSWNRPVSSTNRQASKNHEKFGQRDLHLSKIQTKPVKYTEYDGLKKISGPPPPTISATELRKKMYDHFNGRKNEALPSQQSTKQKCIVRRVEPRKKSTRRHKYDESDYQALQRMPKLRADWESHEDNILLVCKVAATYLSSNPRKQLIDFIAVRDVLCTFSYNSDNKTSCACQRRLTYMLRQPRTVNSIALGVEEIKQDLFVDRRYGSTMERLKNECVSSADYKNRITEIFKELVGYIIKKYYDITEINPKKHIAMPRTAQEFNLLFELIYPAKPHHNQGFTKDVRSTNDIHAATINSLIHSSMCCKKDRRTWAYQLFKVYQRYPDILLRQAMNKIRSDQMVTVKKHHLASVKKFGNYMPTSSSQYQLSINYIHKLQTKWPYEMFKKSYDVFTKLLQWYSEHKNVPSQQQEEILNGIEILPVSCGIVTVIHDLLGRNQIDFDIEMPEQIITLDARYQGKDESFRVEQRYQDILTRLYRFKFENVDAQNAEFFESEMESSKDSSTRKRPIENDDYEKLAKIARRDEECNERKPEEEFEQNKMLIVTESGSVDESIGNLNLKDHSSVHKQNEKKIHRSKKRFIDIEDESMDYEESFLKRARLNSENSTDMEDIEKDEELNLCENLESIRKISSKKTLESLEPLRELKNQVREEALSTQPSTTTNVAVPRRVNEIIKNVPSETSYFSPFSKLNDTNDIEKKYTRIAMLGMREGITEADSHHAHEYFVVNSFKMFYSLETSSLATSSASSNEIENFKNYSIPSQLIPLRIDAVNDLLNKLNRTAIFPKSGISYTDYKDEIMTKKKKIPVEWKYVDAVCEFVREKKEVGACSQELQDKFFDKQGTNLYKAVSLLMENHIFLRSGVTNPRYIHHRYVDSWLIHSCKIYRLEQESVVPFKDSIYAKMQQGETVKTNIEINAKQNKEDTEIDSAIPSTSSDSQGKNVEEVEEKKDEKADNGLNNEDEEKEDSEINEETHGKRMQITCLLPQRDVYKSVAQLDSAIPSTSSDSQGKKVEEVEEKKDEKMDNGLSNEDEKKEDSEINEETHGKRMHKQRTCLLPQRDVYKSAQQLDFTTTEEIKVVIKPWIRVDGVLNRKVLDRMLGAVMNYCLLHPGLTMEKVQSRFIPVLQPFHTRELVEILIKLDCLESKHLKKTRVTVFSQPSAIKINNITADIIDWFAEDEIVLEPAVDAVIKFSIFLSTRLYSTDFIP
ncbi:general transcription factor 3C polypeptide 1 [Camponotus floridanus]|uniref:general transcription factor 3C polypeptide 1 n=1 Tax=Camponotus floridanus TaxID=104421 RepID=UPI000DC67132|nr:general transcription factor 3C polypeptide 1 [Camponotus floridanus]